MAKSLNNNDGNQSAPGKHACKIGEGGNDNVGIDAKPNNDQHSEFFKAILQTKMPVMQILSDSLPVILKHLYKDIELYANKPIGSLLDNPQVSLPVLQQIKEYARRLVESSQTEQEHDAAVVIYYCAIACALLYHDEKITSFSYSKLSDTFTRLAGETWISRENTELFLQAAKICRQKHA